MYPSTKMIYEPIRYWVQIQRGLAYIIDLLLIYSPAIFADQILKVNETTLGLLIILSSILYLPYFIYLEFRFGQTLGKKILGVKVFMYSGKPVTLKAAIFRNVLRIIDGSLITLAIMYLTSKKQRIGDLILHTVVIRMY
jgi:uncharacterized RDD family membrane protein YckC